MDLVKKSFKYGMYVANSIAPSSVVDMSYCSIFNAYLCHKNITQGGEVKKE
jgi:hypothetical protein